MVRYKKPPAVLRLPVALLVLALVAAAPEDDPERRSERAAIPPDVVQRIDVLVHEPTVRPPVTIPATEGLQ